VKIEKNQLLLLVGAIALLVSFLGCEYSKRQPADDAARGLEEFLKKNNELQCKFLRERQDWKEYDAKCKI
jgi:hypothetical protein